MSFARDSYCILISNMKAHAFNFPITPTIVRELSLIFDLIEEMTR